MNDRVSLTIDAARHAPACGCFGSEHECPPPARTEQIDPILFARCYSENYLIAGKNDLKRTPAHD